MTSRKTARRVEFTQRALSDLCEIEQFSIKSWGRKIASRYFRELEAAVDRLQADPEILRLEPAIAPGLYFYRVKKHFLVCDLQADVVIVLTLILTSMDLPARLWELEPRLSVEAEILRTRLHNS